MTRPSWDEYFMSIVDLVGSRATCDRGRSGSVIVFDNRILTTGYVGAPSDIPSCDDIGHEMHTVTHADGSQTKHCIRTIHAEQNALLQAARIGVSLKGATLYCHMAPCYVCAKMIVNVGITRVVCKKDYHSSSRGKELFKEAGIELTILNPETETYPNM